VSLGIATEEVAVAQCENESVRFVRPGGSNGNSGQCWDDAFETLDRALEDLNADPSTVTLIKIAGGTYWPSGTNGSFVIERAVTIQGGFAGTGTNPDARDFDLYETILSGDIGETDDDDPPVFTDNSFHVVDIDSAVEGDVTLEGLTITAGNARNESSCDDRSGGGVRNQALLTTLWMTDCRIVDNQARHGGGVWTGSEATRLRRCHFENNFVVPSACGFGIPSASGGAMDCNRDTHVVECRFIDNRIEGSGRGGAIVSVGDIEVTNSTFIGNRVEGDSSKGGALAGGYKSLVIVSGCLFAMNGVTGDGLGGAIACDQAPSTEDPRQLVLSNSTVADNFIGSGDGGGVFASRAIVSNSIVYGNSDDTGTGFGAQMANVDPDPDFWSIEHSCVAGINVMDYPTCTAADPQFIDAANKNYRLSHCSPLIDAGDDDLIPPDATNVDEDTSLTEPLPWDLIRADRVLGSAVDMGAYEHSTCPADLNNDGVVNGGDLTLLLAQWGNPGTADLNCNGVVDGGDLTLLLAAWGACPSGDSFMGSGSSMESMFSGGSSSLTPALLASLFDFESVEAFSLWLSQQEFETMSSILSLLIGE